MLNNYSETSMLNETEKLCGDAQLSRQYQTDKVLLVKQTAGVRLQTVLGKLLCQCNISHITIYFWAM